MRVLMTSGEVEEAAMEAHFLGGAHRMGPVSRAPRQVRQAAQ